MGVVDELEVIEVDHEDPERDVPALQLLHRRHLHDGLAIPESGQDVHPRFHLELFVRRRQRHLRLRQHRHLNLVLGERRQITQRVEVFVVEVPRRGVADAEHTDSLTLEVEGHAGVEDPGVGESAVRNPRVVPSVVDETDLVVQDGVVAIAVLAKSFDGVEPLHALQPREVSPTMSSAANGTSKSRLASRVIRSKRSSAGVPRRRVFWTAASRLISIAARGASACLGRNHCTRGETATLRPCRRPQRSNGQIPRRGVSCLVTSESAERTENSMRFWRGVGRESVITSSRFAAYSDVNISVISGT